MSRFILGDELGNIKSLRYSPNDSQKDICTLSKVYTQLEEAPAGANIGVQQLASFARNNEDETSTIAFPQAKLAAAFANGSCFVSTLEEDETLEKLLEWTEPRIGSNKFIGMSISESSVYTCTSNGMLRKTPFTLEGEILPEKSQPKTGILPSRLCDWRLSDDGTTFAYGGDEVDLSVWNTERSFAAQPTSTKPAEGSSKKRKRNDDLFPAEIWRARNVQNDSLSLRQPIRITALTYLSSSSNSHHLVTGTQFGDIRRYDTRAARRPVSNWVGIGKVGGVRTVQKGFSEHELFVSDNGSNLSSIDLRTGGVLYSYKGMSGAVTSIAQSSNVLVSAALDRYVRVHSTISPPPVARAHQEHKGQVLEKCYTTCTPTVVVWDKQVITEAVEADDTKEEDEVWDTMEHVT